MSINQNIRFKQPDLNDPVNPEGFYQSIINLKPAYNMLSGNGAPAPELGADGATYIDTVSNIQYLKKNGQWETYYTFSGGSISTAANLGGVGLFDSVAGNSLLFKGLTAGSNITLTQNLNDVEISASSGGEVNTASNVGLGEGQVFKDKVGTVLNLRTLKQAGSTIITTAGDEITIFSSGQTNQGQNVGLPSASQVYKGMIGTNLAFKCLYSGNGDLMTMNDDLAINNIILTPKLTNTLTGIISNIGSLGISYWNSSLAGPAVSAAYVVSSSLTRVYRITAKVLFNALWNITSGVADLEVGYVDSNLVVEPANFVPLQAITLPVLTPNINLVYDVPIGVNLPAGASLVVRLNNISASATAPTADLAVSITMLEI